MQINGATLQPDPDGALYWPEAATLVVADLHLEKGSAFARRGVPLPPYDTRATLDALERCLQRHRPRRVICLGDSFHDSRAAARLHAEQAARLREMTARHEWIWLLGNHDPRPPDLGGRAVESLALGPLLFRHEPRRAPQAGEIAGPLHPKAAIRLRGRRIVRRCFIGDGVRLVLPAFGAYAGGLDVLDGAVSGLFPRGFEVHLLGRGSVHRIPGHWLEGRAAYL